MNTNLMLPLPHQLLAVIGPHAAARLMELAGGLCLRGPLLLLDGGNRANLHPLIRQIRPRTTDPAAALQHITLARAFTCHQVLALVEQARQEAQPGQPVLVLDLLSTFYDESVRLSESARLLRQSLAALSHISRRAPVLISARRPLPAAQNRNLLLELLLDEAAQVWEEAPPPAPAVTQPALF